MHQRPCRFHAPPLPAGKRPHAIMPPLQQPNTPEAALSRTVTIRGDSDDAWQHAADYMGEMMASSIDKPVKH